MFDINNRPKALSQNLVILKVGHTVDVFFGNNGWEPHARFNTKRTNRGVFLTQISGDKVPQKVFKEIISKVN